ncbi:hypothetical protein J2W27_004005 [Variovorax boronicumulans]|uniref:hypothetical protein n=1 Tax=Variovorax boronicumulans TaxID=436515 RepID=UPI002786065C|nr:hypothetical protein [Variovorax boronicumulans]MDP9911881.1 hypothetical protein [Variovorax boronicumulans]
MADPTVIECASACTVTVVHELSIPLLQLAPEQGEEIALAILSVWAIAWCIRQVIVAIRQSGASKEETES